MRRPISPNWLLRLAAELAGEGAGRGQPRNTNLRRATSSAYYALFHAIGLAVADEALPNASENERYGYTRYVTHTAIKEVCDWISGNTPPLHLRAVVDRLRRNAVLSAVASAFVVLQEERESADYDHQADFTRPATLGLVGRPRQAVRSTTTEAASDDFRAFYALIGLQTTIRRR
jgi:hypothetical protein